ncbi:DUF2332 domain-containing protein [Nocardioides ferulae]|uniref:DUF2332 domain-containing protein n=1 Tax=Nocardioides ferulae TaxID=2340821 RepID=UPI000EB5579F|nr:DUF2332 domain-containing protein [Nocardioides ferulae]
MEPYQDVRAGYLEFAAYAEGESPCFEEWARGVADDADVVAWLERLPPLKRQPNLVFAAARHHGVPAPGPYAGLRAALLGDGGEIRATISTRATQTNEVGRLATLVPALSVISSAAGEAPLTLVEAGASAGLCLYPDRWAYTWRTAEGEVHAAPPGHPADGPRLSCEVTGPAPLPGRPPRVAARHGLDLSPVDVTDDDQLGWLSTLVWPEHEDRRERLSEAVRVLRREPPRLVAGDLRGDLAGLVGLVEQVATTAEGPVVVFHSAVVAYLDEPDRRAFAATMAELVAAGTCHWVSNEGPNVVPEVTASAPPAVDRSTDFVLGVDGRAVAWTHGHGRSMHWFGTAG